MHWRYLGLALLVSVSGIQAAPLSQLNVLSNKLNTTGSLQLEKISVNLDSQWKLAQQSQSDGTLLFGFSAADAYVHFYIRSGSRVDMQSTFANGVEMIQPESHEVQSNLAFRTMMTARHLPGYRYASAESHFVFSFATELQGVSYYGYAEAPTMKSAQSAGRYFISHLSENHGARTDRSLTGPTYNGKKYYFGWGAARDSDGDEMNNEVKYDVLHTDDIFTKDIGGNYLGFTLIDSENATQDAITAQWDKLFGVMTNNDMYVQYSSGHGDDDGLLVGVSFDQVRDNALRYPAQEIVIFTMSCDSGALVNGFNDKKSVWSNWQAQGRTLYVSASSEEDENSSTGPGTDPEEPNGPDGSAGSAYGFALWKALIGHADGYVDGVKDGFISLEEIDKYVKDISYQQGSQHPVSTGSYNPKLIMNKVPTAAYLASLKGSTEGLSDAQVMQRIRELDSAWRVR